MGDTIEIIQGTATTIEIAGLQGPQGPAGAAGQGVPAGGSTGQVLRKVSSTNYDTEWAAAASGSGSQADDYEVTDSTKGIILKSPNNTRWRVTIDNNGSLLRTALATLILSALMLCGVRAQVRDLVYGTNNVVVGPTNGAALSFTNSVAFSNPITFGTNADTVRASLGLTASWLTSATNAGAVNRYLVSAGENGEFVTWADMPSVIAGSYTLKGNSDDPYNMDATNVLAYFAFANQWRIYDVEGFKAALFSSGNFYLTNMDNDTGEYNSTLSATTIEARKYENSDGPPQVGRFKIGGVGNAQWELLAGTDGNTNIIRTNYLPAVSGELVTTTLTNVSAPAARTNLGLGSLATNNSVPSGAAATNSILTADGAGGSAFVVSRTVTRFTTNDQTKTNWGFNFGSQASNNDTQMGSWSLDANSFYRVEYAVAWVATTNSGFAHGLGFSTNLSEFSHRTGVGQAASTSVTAINTVTNATAIALANASAAATGGRFAVAGFVYVLTSSNANTMNYRWYPINNSADASTLVRSSMLSVTKMSP